MVVFAACISMCSCTLLAQSPLLMNQTDMPMLPDGQPLIASPEGKIPYQTWRIPTWGDDLKHIWIVASHDLRHCDNVEFILYFHGMHSKDYYDCFRTPLKGLAKSRPDRPFVFIGFVDTPYVSPTARGKNRWTPLAPPDSAIPERLFKTVNHLFKSFRATFPQIKKDKTKIVLAGFSGGGRVLDSVASWLTHTPEDDAFAGVFRSRLSKIVYFDCWFDPAVIDTVPALLANNPQMKIVGTVHMDKPKKHAAMLADKLRLSIDKDKHQLIGIGGRLRILPGKSHWEAMINKLAQALDT
ncbi:MAG: hypothetical protein V2B18_10140 [Pseudomonadota bacterium]